MRPGDRVVFLACALILPSLTAGIGISDVALTTTYASADSAAATGTQAQTDPCAAATTDPLTVAGAAALNGGDHEEAGDYDWDASSVIPPHAKRPAPSGITSSMAQGSDGTVRL